MGWGGQCGCERKIEVIVKMQMKSDGVRLGWSGWMWTKNLSYCEIAKKSGGSGGGAGWSVWIEVIVKMKKVGGGPVRGGGGGGAGRM